MPNIATANEYFKENPEKLVELMLQQNAIVVDITVSHMREAY